MKETMAQYVSPCNEDHTSASIHTAAHGGPHPGTGGYYVKKLQVLLTGSVVMEDPCVDMALQDMV